ncbi:MAG TPA: T9SS type A sorting domain-containing protein, partial [Ignavibacteriaceae bacterium]|nr:T9SS type A sorting domain-containing protein [Ignavibacteriaceae bacterium]
EGNNLLYYGLGELHNPKIHTYNITTHSDSIVYNSENDPGNCMESTWFQSMRWSPNNMRMAFFGFGLEATNTIYTFDSDSGRAYRYTDCGSEGYAYHLTWLNNDTIMYVSNDDNFIYGFTLDHPLLIKEESDHIIPAEFRVSAYPNPFNGTVNINIDGKIKEPEIRIYNINGEEIKRYENIQGSGNRYRELWDGRNNSGENVSSGVYLVIVRDQQNPLSVKGSSKIIYLK